MDFSPIYLYVYTASKIIHIRFCIQSDMIFMSASNLDPNSDIYADICICLHPYLRCYAVKVNHSPLVFYSQSCLNGAVHYIILGLGYPLILMSILRWTLTLLFDILICILVDVLTMCAVGSNGFFALSFK